MDRLDGWKAIAAYLRRDERTARRWAAESGLPVHRMPGPGRGSVYAMAQDIDAWLEADRKRPQADIPHAVVVEPITPSAVEAPPLAWWRRRWTVAALIAAGVMLVGAGALTSRQPRGVAPPSGPVFADPAAKAMFLQASYDWNLRTTDSLARAVKEFGETIARDPRVPAAYVGLANSYLLLREFGSLPDADAYPRAEAAAKAATALAPDCAEAHRALAFTAFWWRQDRATARREFQRALALKPNDPLTHHWLANALLANGEPSSALREIDKARDLDPDATSIVADRAAILYFAGRHAEGLAALRDLAREQPQLVGPHRALAEIALFEGRADEFLREATATARLRADGAELADVERWRASGPSLEGIEDAMLRDASKAGTGWFQIARRAAVAGRRFEAKDALAHACRLHEPTTVSAPSDLWLSRALTPRDVIERCGRAAQLS